MKKATTKSERKWGKKEEPEITKVKKKKEEPIMYKILIDWANFTKPMTYEDCLAFIEDKNKQAAKEFGRPPSMTLVLA